RLSSCVPLLPLGLANLWRQSSRAAAVLLAACIGWGLFAGHLYWNGIQDLSLVLRGTPSELGSRALPEEGVVSDPAEARARAARPGPPRPPPPSLPPRADYWAPEPGGRGALGIAATWLLIGAALAACALALARASPRRLLAAALGCVLAGAVAAHLR